MAGKCGNFTFSATKPWQIGHLVGKGVHLGGTKKPSVFPPQVLVIEPQQ